MLITLLISWHELTLLLLDYHANLVREDGPDVVALEPQVAALLHREAAEVALDLGQRLGRHQAPQAGEVAPRYALRHHQHRLKYNPVAPW